MAANAALRVDEVVRGPVLIVESLPDGIVIVERDRIGDFQVRDGAAHIARILLERKLRGMDADHHQPMILIFVVPTLHIGQRAQAIDAGISPEIDEHHLAAQPLRRQGWRIQPGRGSAERRQVPFDGQTCGMLGLRHHGAAGHHHGAAGRRIVHGHHHPRILRRHGRLDAADEGTLQPAGPRERQTRQHRRIPAEHDGHHGEQHDGAQPPPHPFARAQRFLEGGKYPSTGENGGSQRCGGARRIGEQQQGGARVRPRNRGARQHQPEDWTRAGRPQQSRRHSEKNGVKRPEIRCA